MKRIKSLLALLLAMTMIFTQLSACGKKEPGPSSDPGKTVTTPAQQDNEPNNTDTMTTTSSSQQNEEPAASSDAETPSDAQPETETEKPTYGGIRMEQIGQYIWAFVGSDSDMRTAAYGTASANRVAGEFNNFGYEALKNQEDGEKWLDEIFLEPVYADYANISQDELDELRNMILVSRIRASFYYGMPDDPNTQSLLKTFLGETGIEVYERWNMKLAEQPDSLVNRIMNESEEIADMNRASEAILEAEFGPTQSPDFEITDLVVNTSNFEVNGDTYIAITASCPELAGSGWSPRISLIFFDDNGKEIESREAHISKRDKDAGVYTCNFTFNTVELGTDVPLEGHVYAYRSVSGSQYSTVDDCKFVY